LALIALHVRTNRVTKGWLIAFDELQFNYFAQKTA
jgi:hypothetical protein